MKTTIALIVAAGRGVRAGEGLPKQYRLINGEMVLRKTLQAFAIHPLISYIQVVINPDDLSLYQQAMQGIDKLLPVKMGGATRQASVLNGLQELKADDVLIHDAARPFVSQALISRCIEALECNNNAIPALPLSDTIRHREKGLLNRDELLAMQTPQGFNLALILKAHTQFASENYTDDAALFEVQGIKLHYIKGEIENVKMTYESDFKMQKQIRVGQGYDVHAFGAGDFVMLGGVKIPHTQGIIAHSDGDVILHALTDAILGVLGDGDIGSHFPPSDMAWKGAASHQFLSHACALLHKRGGTLNHLDVTLVCESPKITPHRENIRAEIAKIAGIPLSSVSLKATTSEKMGFTGRKEGLAALALATVLV